MGTENLATEILHELKTQSKRYFILFVVTIILLFASNLAWLYAWNKTDKSCNLNGNDNANVVYSQGDVDISGEK